MRPLTKNEELKLKTLTEQSISLTLIEPTETGLKKSIMDATGSVRYYLKSNNIHDYALQAQGQNHKIIIDGFIYKISKTLKTTVSLYKPNTKKGDPRIWISGLQKYSNSNDLIALIVFKKVFHIVNLTQIPITELIESEELSPLKELVKEINGTENEIANELLAKLKTISQSGPIPSLLDADTSVGRTLETALGIPINSSQKPDYKGIELKSFRSKRRIRKNLFTKVPNWEMSTFKSSAQILESFGYFRDDIFRLYCTVSANNINSQGLSLRVDSEINQLIETSINPEVGDFAVWLLEGLHNSLLEKHNETFWITADIMKINGKDYFHYTETEHTKKPIISQFNILLEQGKITIDHLIKRTKTGGATEKGPAFKLHSNSLSLLFPPSAKYFLS